MLEEPLLLLSKCARAIHSTPPTLASTERVFSIFGLVLGNRRTILLAFQLDDVLVIRSRLRDRSERHDK